MSICGAWKRSNRMRTETDGARQTRDPVRGTTPLWSHLPFLFALTPRPLLAFSRWPL